MSLLVKQPGILSLLQDRGRYGRHDIGLTTGGPMDRYAFHCCNALLGNSDSDTLIELHFGGLVLESRIETHLCLTGADMGLKINNTPLAGWETHRLTPGDLVEIGYATEGCRAYLGVSGGFAIPPMFGSAATVLRESIGGLNGKALAAGDQLPCVAGRPPPSARYRLAGHAVSRYANSATLRAIPGYQHALFSRAARARFYNSDFTLTERSDRMGCRLEGPFIECEREGILSEGICLGAIQVPADGQPIILLQDRQTIGGYPKLGAVFSLDIARLAQCKTGARISFTAMSEQEAHNELHLAAFRHQHLPIERLSE